MDPEMLIDLYKIVHIHKQQLPEYCRFLLLKDSCSFMSNNLWKNVALPWAGGMRTFTDIIMKFWVSGNSQVTKRSWVQTVKTKTTVEHKLFEPNAVWGAVAFDTHHGLTVNNRAVYGHGYNTRSIHWLAQCDVYSLLRKNRHTHTGLAAIRVFYM